MHPSELSQWYILNAEDIKVPFCPYSLSAVQHVHSGFLISSQASLWSCMETRCDFSKADNKQTGWSFIYREAPDTSGANSKALRYLRLLASKCRGPKWVFRAHFWGWAPSRTGQRIGPATWPPAGSWTVAVTGDVFSSTWLPWGPVLLGVCHGWPAGFLMLYFLCAVWEFGN